MNDEKVSEQVRQVIADYDAAHPGWQQNKRDREAREHKEAEERAQRALATRRQTEQQQAATNSATWANWVDQRIAEHLEANWDSMRNVIGNVIAKERASQQKAVNAAVAEATRGFEAKLAMMEQRISGFMEQSHYRVAASADRALGEAVASERTERQKEIKAAVAEAQRGFEAKVPALEERIIQRAERHTEQYNHSLVASTGRALSEAIAAERKERQQETKAAVEEAQRAGNAKLEALEQRILQRIEQRAEQSNHSIVVASSDRARALSEAMTAEREARHGEIKDIVSEVQRASDAKLAAAEQRIIQHIIQHIEQRIEQGSRGGAVSAGRAISEALATERVARQKEIRTAVDEVQRASDAKLAAAVEHLQSVPGKLPVAKVWRPETVSYRGDFVCHEGALYQAREDTAQLAGGSEWLCVARAGRDGTDGRTPNICGTYNVLETYKQLDIVASDGAAFIAKFDNPGVCPGDGWQMISRQGKPGRPDRTGERGPRGEKGEPGVVSQIKPGRRCH